MEIRGNGNEGDKCCLCRLKFECSYANGNGPIVPMIMIKKCLSLKIIMIMALDGYCDSYKCRLGI